jgi:hypothetical protein
VLVLQIRGMVMIWIGGYPIFENEDTNWLEILNLGDSRSTLSGGRNKLIEIPTFFLKKTDSISTHCDI